VGGLIGRFLLTKKYTVGETAQYRAVLDVMGGKSVSVVAKRLGVSAAEVKRWVARGKNAMRHDFKSLTVRRREYKIYFWFIHVQNKRLSVDEYHNYQATMNDFCFFCVFCCVAIIALWIF